MKMQSYCSTTLRSKRRDEGFTVAEFVAAASILLIVLVGVLGAVQFAGASTRMASSRQAAVDLATHQIELARNLPWASVGLKYSDGTVGNPSGSVPAYQKVTTAQGTFDVNNSIVWMLDTTNMRSSYKKIVTTVSWSDPAPGGSLSVETNIFGVGGDANTGDVLVTARDDDDPTKMVQGIGVTINGQFVPTGTDGKAFFGRVAIGTATFSASSPSYLVDSSGLTLPLVVASGYQNIGFIDCQTPSTAIIKVVGNGNSALSGATVTLVDTDPNHPRTLTGTSGADGTCVFSGLWKSSTSAQPYNVSATYNGRTSSGTFLVTAGGQTINQTLTIVEPSVITVTVKDAVSGNVITGTNAIIAVTDQSTGSNLAGSPATVTNGTATFAITKNGNYNVSVTGVTGYPDSPTNVVAATFGTGANNVTITLSPITRLWVAVMKKDSSTSATSALAAIPVTVVGPSGTLAANTAATTGIASFLITTAGSYNLSAVVNQLTYYATPTNPVTLLAGQSLPSSYSITVMTGGIKVTSSGWSGSSKRWYAIYDANGVLMGSSSMSSASTWTLTGLPPGAYTIRAFGSGQVVGGTPIRDTAVTVTAGTTPVSKTAASPN